MSFLIVYVSENRFAIDCSNVLQVFPRVDLKKVSHAADYVSGLFNLGGNLIPVIDFCSLIEQRPASLSFHTRIILLEEPSSESSKHKMGLIAEKVFTFMPKEMKDFISAEFQIQDHPYLDGIFSDEYGIVQNLDVGRLFKVLSPELFRLDSIA